MNNIIKLYFKKFNFKIVYFRGTDQINQILKIMKMHTKIAFIFTICMSLLGCGDIIY